MTNSNKNLDSDALFATSLSEDELADDEQLLPETEEESIQPPSEVAMRLNLLGKLIIPPSAP